MGFIATGKLSDFVKLETALLNADITTDRESTFRPAEGFTLYRAHLQTGTVAATKKATVQLLQAKDASGTGKKALTDPVEFTAGDGGEVAEISVEAKQEDLDSNNGFTHIAVKVTCDNATAVVGAAVLELGGASYKPVG